MSFTFKAILLAPHSVSAHYTWVSISGTANWEVVRRTNNYNTQNPIVNVYLAKVPSGSGVTTWAGDGTNRGVRKFTTPHLLLAYTLHVADALQFYLNCAQIRVTIRFSIASLESLTFFPRSGTGTPSPLVAIPGAYPKSDPGGLCTQLLSWSGRLVLWMFFNKQMNVSHEANACSFSPDTTFFGKVA
ncbi:hypothetical protein BT69DRAFT_1301581 [Atractiella rhizophila]|nr:hypothetical protein BT69DRAFT_1301581 [Atractiella rhizophila]